MVYKRTKWICGLGETDIYYCNVCGAGHMTRDQAINCEDEHIRKHHSKDS